MSLYKSKEFLDFCEETYDQKEPDYNVRTQQVDIIADKFGKKRAGIIRVLSIHGVYLPRPKHTSGYETKTGLPIRSKDTVATMIDQVAELHMTDAQIESMALARKDTLEILLKAFQQLIN